MVQGDDTKALTLLAFNLSLIASRATFRFANFISAHFFHLSDASASCFLYHTHFFLWRVRPTCDLNVSEHGELLHTKTMLDRLSETLSAIHRRVSMGESVEYWNEGESL